MSCENNVTTSNEWTISEEERSIKSINENREVRWPVKRKIGKKLYKRRLNARIRRLVLPKSALVVFSELFHDVPIQIEELSLLGGLIYTAKIEIDGQIYIANKGSKTEAKQKACENLLRNMLAKQLNMQSEEKNKYLIDIGINDGEKDTAPKPIGPPQEDFPWTHFASLAMHQLLNQWKILPKTLPPKAPAPMKMFPEDPKKYHPIQLLNHMKPGTQFTYTFYPNPPTFQVECVIDGLRFNGIHSIKKAAKLEACIAAIKHFWEFDFHSVYY